MWIGKGEFDSFGYQKSAYIKGKMDNLEDNQCYQIIDEGPPNGSEQFQFVPVDQEGHKLGPAKIKTAGQAVYPIWEQGRTASEYDISNTYIS